MTRLTIKTRLMHAASLMLLMCILVTVTALDANDNTIKERVFENVPVIRNQVTRYTGSFFGNGGGGETGSGDFRMTADPDWNSVNGYTF